MITGADLLLYIGIGAAIALALILCFAPMADTKKRGRR